MIKIAVVASLLAFPKGQSAELSKKRSDNSNQTGARQGTHNPRTAKADSTLNLAASDSRMGVSAIYPKDYDNGDDLHCGLSDYFHYYNVSVRALAYSF